MLAAARRHQTAAGIQQLNTAAIHAGLISDQLSGLAGKPRRSGRQAYERAQRKLTKSHATD